MVDITRNIIVAIFSLFNRLIELDCSRRGSNWFRARFPPADPSSNIFFSSSIVRLRVDVATLDDCLYLLDGRLPSLKTLIIEIELIDQSDVVADTKVCRLLQSAEGSTSLILLEKILANLKSLSFSSFRRVNVYNSLINPLLRRMTGLEELSLRLFVTDRSTFIESTHLNREVLPYLPHLRTFNVDIVTYASSLSDVLEQQTKEIQYLSYNGECHPLVCYTARPQYRSARSHIFSLPFMFDSMQLIFSHFPGDLFPNVRQISLSEIHGPFEHKFFVQIATSFPRLTRLTLADFRLQEEKRIQGSNDTKPTVSAVEFKYLTNLLLIGRHGDYAEQFLVETNALLPRLTTLTIEYEQLFIVTENFTRDASRRNCSNIEHLELDKPFVYSKEMYLYFPRCR